MKGIQNISDKQYERRTNLFSWLLFVVFTLLFGYITFQLAVFFYIKSIESAIKPESFRGNYIQRNSIRAVIPSYFIDNEVLGDLMKVENNSLRAGTELNYEPPKEVIKERNDDLLERIIFCESSGNPNAKNLSSTARGLFQIIKSSEEFCEKGLGKQLNMFSPEDNYECGQYLWEHGGETHWLESKKCWNNL